MNPQKALEKAVRLAGGQTRLAKVLGGKTRQGHVWKWLNMSHQAPPEQVIPISCATNGEVTPHDLRPDLYEKGWIPTCVKDKETTA